MRVPERTQRLAAHLPECGRVLFLWSLTSLPPLAMAGGIGPDAGVRPNAEPYQAPNRSTTVAQPAPVKPTVSPSTVTDEDETETDPGVGATPEKDQKGSMTPEYKRPD